VTVTMKTITVTVMMMTVAKVQQHCLYVISVHHFRV
jgi:hypothetical protein